MVAPSRTLPSPQATCIDSIAILAMVPIIDSLLFERFCCLTKRKLGVVREYTSQSAFMCAEMCHNVASFIKRHSNHVNFWSAVALAGDIWLFFETLMKKKQFAISQYSSFFKKVIFLFRKIGTYRLLGIRPCSQIGYDYSTLG